MTFEISLLTGGSNDRIGRKSLRATVLQSYGHLLPQRETKGWTTPGSIKNRYANKNKNQINKECRAK